MQLSSVHFSPEFFPDPKKFKPERWLDENNKIIKDEHWIPFGFGKFSFYLFNSPFHKNKRKN